MSNLRVICIDNSPGKHGFAAHLLVQGKEYDVSQAVEPGFEDAYDVCGLLFNPATGGRIGFLKKRFIPLSQIDETEMTRENLNENNLVKY